MTQTNYRSSGQLMEVPAFAAELARQNEPFVKRDFMVDPRQLRFETDAHGTMATLEGRKGESGELERFPVTDLAHGQIATFTEIPKAYYDRMRAEQHGLLDTSVHTWLDSLGGKRRMVRTLDGRLRAVLSDRFRRIDNYDLGNVILPILAELGAEFRHLAITEEKMFIKAIFPQMRGEVRPGLGDVVQLGVTIENSEVGRGSVSVLPMSLRLVCMNGATHNKYGVKRNHVGSQITGGEEAYELFSTEAMEADDKALMLKVRDVVKATASQVLLDNILGDMRDSMAVDLATAPALAVAELGRTKGLTEGTQTTILEHLLAGGTMTQWGLVNAITRSAQDAEDYQSANDLERLGGDILSLSRAEFAPIANAKDVAAKKRGRAAK